MLRLRKLRFLRLVCLDSPFLEQMLQLLLLHVLDFLCRRKHKLRDHPMERHIQSGQIPLFRIHFRGYIPVYGILHILGDHVVNRIPHALSVQHPAAFPVDDLPLFIHDLVIFQQVLTDSEVVALYLLLRLLNGAGKHLMFDLFVLFHAQRIEHAHQLLGTEQTQQVILQGNVKAGFSRVALTSGTSPELVVDPPGLMPLRADDLQSAGCLGLLVQLDIRTPACHVGGDGHSPVQPGVRHDLRFHLMELGIQDIVLDSLLFQHFAQKLRYLDGNGTHQNRLSCGMGFLDRFHDCPVLSFLRLIDRVVQILPLNRKVGGDLHDVHPVNIPEFLFLCQRGTGHTAFLLEFIEQVLKGNGGQGLALPPYLHMLLRFNGLMESVRIASSRHDTSGKFVNDDHLSFRGHHIILVAEHQIVRPQRKDDIVLNL